MGRAKQDAAQLKAVFTRFDADEDGYLNLDEFNCLQMATGSDAAEEGSWPGICAAFGCDPAKGFDVKALGEGYTQSEPGQLQKDFEVVQRLASAERGELEDGEASDDSGD